MPTYRLYRLDGADKIVSAEWIEAETDAHALEQAESGARPEGVAYELWDRNRLVARNRTAGR